MAAPRVFWGFEPVRKIPYSLDTGYYRKMSSGLGEYLETEKILEERNYWLHSRPICDTQQILCSYNAPVIWNPAPPFHPGHGGDIYSVWVWKPVKFPDTGQKYWVKSLPLPLGTQLYKPKSHVWGIGCDCLSLIPRQILKSISKWRLWLWVTQIIYVKCSNNLPSGAKMRQLTNEMWTPRSLA